MTLDTIKARTKRLKIKYFQKIMYRLINIYERECFINEGELGLSDLLIIITFLEDLEEGRYRL